ncbi:MAG: hypothetical protein ACREA0_03905 [bacterium]
MGVEAKQPDLPGSEAPLQVWRRIIEKSAFANFAALRRAFRVVDKIGSRHPSESWGPVRRWKAHMDASFRWHDEVMVTIADIPVIQ